MCILLSLCRAFGGSRFISMEALAMIWIIIGSTVVMPEEGISNNSKQYKFLEVIIILSLSSLISKLTGASFMNCNVSIPSNLEQSY